MAMITCGMHSTRISMKTYRSPSFNRYGDVADVTRAFGQSSANDTIFNSDGAEVGRGQGSQDGVIVPCGPEAPEDCR